MPDSSVSQISKNVEAFGFNSRFTEHYVELLVEHEKSGLAPPHLRQELATYSRQKLFSAIWEAMLYRHFHGLGCRFAKSLTANKGGQNGPDLGIVIEDGTTLWIEAVVPTPGTSAVLQKYAQFQPGVVRSVPSKEMLLCVTGALDAKTKNYRKRLAAGIVKSADPYFVAINTMMLSSTPGYDLGISQFPLVVEAVCGIGPLQAEMGFKSGKTLDLRPAVRPQISSANGSPVSTWQFNDGGLPVTGVIGSNRQEIFDGHTYGSVVLNAQSSGFLLCPQGVGFWGTLDGFVVTSGSADEMVCTRSW